MDCSANSMILALTLCLVFQSGDACRVSLGSPSIYAPGDLIALSVNSLTSIETLLPLSYYSLPFCLPLEGVRNYARNIGELLMGDKIQNSPYRIRMYKNESETFLCRTNPLSVPDLNLLKRRIDEMYQVNMILDYLPVIRYSRMKNSVFRWTGYPVGVRVADSYYVFNHLKFKILVDREEDAVVGFELVPCSYSHNPGLVKHLRMYSKYPYSIQCHPSSVAMKIEENKPIIYSYEVTFEESNIKWPHRWDAYLKMEGASVHWFSIMNSLLVIAFLSGSIIIIFRRTMRNSNQYEKLDQEANAKLSDEKSPEPWKFRARDVFHVPACPMLLCVMTGSGIQILGAAAVSVLFAFFGFTSPASRGSLLTSLVLLYVVFGIAAGYVAFYVWRMIGCEDQKDWVKVSLGAACVLPGVAFFTLAAINVLLWSTHSTGAIPFYGFGALLLLWLGICVPLTLIGGYLASKAPGTKSSYPVNRGLEEIPPRKALLSWLYALLAGTFPFGTLYIELFFIISSFWMGRYYDFFGHLLIVMTLLVVISAEASIVVTSKRISNGDWQWWWKSFFASGSAGIYVFVYCINYLVYDLRYLSGPVSIALYLAYSFLLALAVMLATGAVGFLASLSFLKYYLPSVAADLDTTTTPDSKGTNPEDGFSCRCAKECDP